MAKRMELRVLVDVEDQHSHDEVRHAVQVTLSFHNYVANPHVEVVRESPLTNEDVMRDTVDHN